MTEPRSRFDAALRELIQPGHAGSCCTLTASRGRDQETGVPASVLCMSMSLDGYIAGPVGGPGNPGGDGFMRLHEWPPASATASAAEPGDPPPAGCGCRSRDGGSWPRIRIEAVAQAVSARLPAARRTS